MCPFCMVVTFVVRLRLLGSALGIELYSKMLFLSIFFFDRKTRFMLYYRNLIRLENLKPQSGLESPPIGGLGKKGGGILEHIYTKDIKGKDS